MWWMNLESIIYSAVREKQVSKRKTNILMHIYGIYKNGTDEPIRREGKETQMKIKDMWTQWGKERAGQSEKVALTYILYHA